MRALLAYLARICAWVSQGLNCLILFGHHDQTVSARCYVNRLKPVWRVAYRLVNCIFFWQEDHCKSSHESDLKYASSLKAV